MRWSVVAVTHTILSFRKEGAMSGQVSIAVVGDHDPSSVTHRATDASLDHAAAALGVDLARRWVSTPELAAGAGGLLARDAGVWIAPGSPYASMDGALAAIRLAREEGMPLLGTCGGYQHVVIEFARHVLGFADAQHAEYDPYSSTLFVTPLSCSLVGLTMPVRVVPGSLAAGAYGTTGVEERYYCNFGLDPAHQALLDARGLRVAATDADGEARILELAGHPFFVATLFVPQTGSSPGRPHPLVTAFVRAAAVGAGRRAAQLSSAE
jgi:CTP synthase (UTP-ammonia lyase)